MVVMKTAYKYRVYPSKEQKEILNRQMFLAKELYNLLLEKSKAYHKETGKTLTEYRMNIWITQLKHERPEFAELHSQVLQNVSKRVSDAYRHFFRRCKEKKQGKKVKAGFPRYKKFVFSLTYPQLGFRLEKKRVELSRIGRINFVNHREIEGKIKTLTIKETKSQELYITISVEKEDKPFVSNNKPKVGIDLGVNQYAALSDNTIIQNAKITKHQRNHARVLQQNISRKEKGSNNRRNAVIRFAKYSEHIARIRQDRLHKISHQLVNSYSLIAYEELEIPNMVKSHRFARSIGECSWGRFTDYLQYKAESAGCVAVGANPKNTSKTCSDCGNIQYISLSERTFACNKCGMSKDRDLNASVNILNRATSGQGGSNASGDNARPLAREAVVKERGTIIGDSR